MTAEWKDIPGFEGLYQASTAGQIRSVDREVPDSRGHTRRLKGRVLKTQAHHAGYRLVMLSKNGKTVRESVHKLVTLTFIGPRPSGLEVRHLDNDPANNSLSNLQYSTHVENEADKLVFGTHPNAKKTHCKRGHPLSGHNLYLPPAGGRTCRTCAYASIARYQARKQLERVAA